MGRPNPRRYYPVGPLAEALGVTPIEALNRAGVTDATRKGHRYLEVGLLPKAADRLATRLGFHPAEVWPSWVEDTIADLGRVCAAVDCTNRFLPESARHRYCSTRCKHRAAARRRRATPEGAARDLATRRRYYAENGAYERARQARYDRENAARIAARRRAARAAAREDTAA